MYMNKHNLKRLVIKTHGFVKDTVFNSGRHKETVIKIILDLCDAADVRYDKDYFVENIGEIFDEVADNGYYGEDIGQIFL